MLHICDILSNNMEKYSNKVEKKALLLLNQVIGPLL